MKHVILAFGLLIFALLVLFRLARFNHFRQFTTTEILIGIFSVLFFTLGILIARRVFPGKRDMVPPVDNKKQITNEEALEKTGISKREYEILLLIEAGLSNQQIASKLFLSEHTIKKHISNLFFKLDAGRRTEAIKKSKELGIIP